jgi:serine/threonine-protein kinase
MVNARQIIGGRYDLKDRLAAGAMGVVYQAFDQRLERLVALKILNEGLASEDKFVERFRREARSAAALSHPNIASVFDHGEDKGLHYLVMELVPGTDLARLLRDEGALSPDRAQRIALQTADALAHAHAADLVHRDMKPANILISTGDDVKVTDFGIARAGGSSTLTATGSVLGTAYYMSPEQASSLEVTPRSDVYSLGIVMFEMLTGVVPFAGDNVLAIAMRHASDDVPSPLDLRPDLDPSLADVVITATRRDPARRYVDGAAMAAVLRTVGSSADGAAATVALAAPASTLTLKEPAETAVLPPITGRWNPQKVGRLVIGVALVLLVLTTAAGIARFLDARDSAATAPSTTDASPRTTVTTSPATAPSLQVPSGLIGLEEKEASKLVEAEDLVPVAELVASDAREGTVVDTKPGGGSTVTAGDTITLFISEGAPTSDEEEPGKGKGKGHGQGKGKKK